MVARFLTNQPNKETTMLEFCTVIDDEEYIVVVKSYTPGKPGRTYGNPEDCYPPEPPEAEFDLIDEMTGKPADDAACQHYQYIVDRIDDEMAARTDDEDNF